MVFAHGAPARKWRKLRGQELWKPRRASLEFGVWRLEFGAWSLALDAWSLELVSRLEFGPNAQITRHSDDYLLLSTGSLACPAISCCPTTIDQHQEL